ncbi:subtilisin-like protease SBT4.3 isoform X2 [Quercus lobata]|uniref:subtilisin-like protease SBT4.3 isoform X2 n=1 Tax=Quercus lobata TaxID=97700 RepID=UPI00124948D3|nr:subtilisin-like protease SBT4.3 isoform X2 [Quercus lobata]
MAILLDSYHKYQFRPLHFLNPSIMTAMSSIISPFHFLLILLVAAHSICCGATDKEKDVYIVYMGSLPEGQYSPTSHHLSLLEEILGESAATESIVRSYTRSFNAFAARLSNEEQQRIASKKEVLSVFPSRTLQLQTTRSWEFIGLAETAKRNPAVESDVIIGVLDTGIWPESESFSDKGYGPPPKKWKGTCKGGSNFTCNNKIIGARAYSSDQNSSVRDEEGHGSHTASTAAGSKVPDASFYGVAKGIARGGVPSARIAAYKVCDSIGCAGEDVLAAFDDAIADGVDLISISLGGEPIAVDSDIISIGSFHAMEKGILTVHSAGNEGPSVSSVSSVAPWLFSVAASSTDRKIITKVVLANGKTLTGNAVNSFTLNGTKFPLVYGKAASRSCSDILAWNCIEGCLDSRLVEGKIVVCNDPNVIEETSRVGALGTIILGDDQKDVSFVLPLPASILATDQFSVLQSFLNSTKNPQGSILKSETTKDTHAPVVASFSSRGPNSILEDILKPDISAPGIEILAAFSPVASLSSFNEDKRHAKYNILSGTSMACPHVTGAAAYIKTFHPDWSPSAIKSALMTTAWPMNATIQGQYEDGEFAFGAGHINPVKAKAPGLVYEASKDDYLKMLCSINITTFGTCPKHVTGSPKDLNYPSIQAQVNAVKKFTVEFPRTATNVGPGNSTYVAKVDVADSDIKVSVKPGTLSFKSSGEKKSFIVTVSGKGLKVTSRLSASLVWSDGTHNVRSPIVVYTNSL